MLYIAGVTLTNYYCYPGNIQRWTMEIYQIENLDCRKKENRIKLVKAVNKIIKNEGKPSIKLLEKWYRSLSKKYKMHANIFEISKHDISLNINVYSKFSYSTMVCKNYYEALCKYILFVYIMQKRGKK